MNNTLNIFPKFSILKYYEFSTNIDSDKKDALHAFGLSCYTPQAEL